VWTVDLSKAMMRGASCFVPAPVLRWQALLVVYSSADWLDVCSRLDTWQVSKRMRPVWDD
jgi:hypothetical protein